MKMGKQIMVLLFAFASITVLSCGGGSSNDSDGDIMNDKSDSTMPDIDKNIQVDKDNNPNVDNEPEEKDLDVNDDKPDNKVPDIDNTPPVDNETPDNTDQDSIVIDNTPGPDSDQGDIVSIDGVDMNLKNEDTSSVTWNGKISKVEIGGSEDSKTYTIKSNETFRCERSYVPGLGCSDKTPKDTELKVEVGFTMSGEQKALVVNEGSDTQTNMTIRTGNDMLDALFAMSLREVDKASEPKVSRVNGGDKYQCKDYNGNNTECFVTGIEWPIVWTRDTSYAIDLSLAAITPTYSAASLLFKTSDKKDGGGKEIIQDTGTGGSWPVSTDRTIWALAALETLKYLDGAERTAFVNSSYDAVKNTVESDRKYVYDPNMGLYRGEQSFLDWREQTYPVSTLDDVTPIASSKALSTNAAHYSILKLATLLADEKGDSSLKTKYSGWAEELKKAINDKMWIEDEGLYTTMILNEFDPTPLKKYDMLGEALTIVLGIADQAKAKRIIENYPNTSAGVPVIWPQHNEVFVYHNRSIWPFVTAYGLNAAKIAKNDAFINLNVASLINGAALNLSNMENFEFTMLSNAHKDDSPAYFDKKTWVTNSSGPPVNSYRQLWSVAAFPSMVFNIMFGLEASQDGIRFQPLITRKMRNSMFGNSKTIKLNKFPYKGKEVNIEVFLPPVDNSIEGYYTASSVKLNGVEKGSSFISASDLSNGDTINVYVLRREKSGSSIIELNGGDINNDPKYFAPNTPGDVEIKLVGGKLQVTFAKNNPIKGVNYKDNKPYDVYINNASESALYNIYKDGILVKEGLSLATWTDDASSDHSSKTHCYAVEAMYPSSKNRSHHAYGCYWGETSSEANRPLDRIWEVDNSGSSVNKTFKAGHTGKHYIQFAYVNNSHGWETAVTAGLKVVTIKEGSSEITKGPIAMAIPGINRDNPNAPSNRVNNSTILVANLEKGKTYSISTNDGHNMSFFNYFDFGGWTDQWNAPEIKKVKVFFIGD